MSSKTFSETLTQGLTFFHGLDKPAPSDMPPAKEFEAFYDAAPRLEDFEGLVIQNTLPKDEKALRDAQVKRQAEPIISSYLSTAMISAVCYESQRRTGTYVTIEDPYDPSSTRNSSIARASYEFVSNLVDREFEVFLEPHKENIRKDFEKKEGWQKKNKKAQNKAIDEELDLRIKNALEERKKRNDSSTEQLTFSKGLPDKLDSAWREEAKRFFKQDCLGLLFKHTPDTEHQRGAIEEIFKHVQEAVPSLLAPIDNLLSKDAVTRKPHDYISELYPEEKQQKYSNKIHAKNLIFTYFTSHEAIPDRVMNQLFLSALTSSFKAHPIRHLAGIEAGTEVNKARDEVTKAFLGQVQTRLVTNASEHNAQAEQANTLAAREHEAPVCTPKNVGVDDGYNEVLNRLASYTQQAYSPQATDSQHRKAVEEVLNDDDNFKNKTPEESVFAVFCDAISHIQTTAGLKILLNELDHLLTQQEKKNFLNGFLNHIETQLVDTENKTANQFKQSLGNTISKITDTSNSRILYQTVSGLMTSLPNHVRSQNSNKDPAHQAIHLALQIQDTAEELETAVKAKQTRKRIAYAISTLLAATGLTLLLMTLFSPIAIPSMVFGFILLAAVTGYLATYSNYSLNSRRTFGKSQAFIIAATTAALLMANAISLGAGWMVLFGFCGFSANLLLYRTDVPALLKAITPEWDVREWDWSLAGIANKLVNLVLFSMSAVTGYVFTMAMMTSIFILLAKTSLVALSIVGAPYIAIPIFLVALLCNISFAHRGFLKLKNRVIDAWNGINTSAVKPEVITVGPDENEDDYKYMRDFENNKITGFKAVGFMLLNLLFFIQPTDSVERRVAKVIASLCLILPLLALVTWFSQQPMVTSLIIKIVGFHVPNALSYLAPLYLPVVQLQSVLLILAATQRITIFIDKIRTVFYSASTGLFDLLSSKFSSTKDAKNDGAAAPLTQATKEKYFSFKERVRQKLLNEDHEIWADKFHDFCPTTESDDSDQQHAAYLRHIYAVALWQHASLFDKAYAYLKAIVETAFNTLAPILILVNGAANGVMAENGIPSGHPYLGYLALGSNSISSSGANGNAFLENRQKASTTNKFRAPLMVLLTPPSTPPRKRTPSPALPAQSQSAPPPTIQQATPAAQARRPDVRETVDDTKVYAAPPAASDARKAVTSSYEKGLDETTGRTLVAVRSEGSADKPTKQLLVGGGLPRLAGNTHSTRRKTISIRRSADSDAPQGSNANATLPGTVARPASEYGHEMPPPNALTK